ncbi:family 10 glycosylhydrolase [Cytobacillus sp.]|uniref:glycoside hydrolase family 10 protein n=1 Tax=Cytobacillus sp. TaxID=2675269 RepID=UPI0037BF93D6
MKIVKKTLMVSLILVLMGTTILQFPRGGQAETLTTYKNRELRAVWIASVTNIDWPSKKGLSITKQKQEFTKLLDDAEKMGMNAVIVQVKPTADAFYPSKFGPWSEYLTGTQGKNPGYDPLAFMIDEAHKRNLEFHAWFNPYRISMNHTNIKRLSADHPARKHQNWVESYGGKLYYNPGLPEVKKFIIDGVLEVVKNYDIDGVHMDDYFYPYKVKGKEFPDTAEFKKYGKGKFKTVADWRRDNVNQLVRDLNKAIKKEKPYVKFGISPFGVWRNIAKDPTGSKTTAGLSNYDDLYADTREWIRKGYIDYITPQIYWNIGFKPAAYDILLDWWMKETSGKPVHLYIGQAAYKIKNDSSSAWKKAEEYPKQIQLNRQFDAVMGSMHFSLKDLNRNPLGIKDRLTNDLYKQPALIPTMPWLDHVSLQQPNLLHAARTINGIELTIEDNPLNKDTAYYAIYRLEEESIEGSANLIKTLRKNGEQQMFLDKTAEANKKYTYVITSLDRLHNESDTSSAVIVEVK